MYTRHYGWLLTDEQEGSLANRAGKTLFYCQVWKVEENTHSKPKNEL